MLAIFRPPVHTPVNPGVPLGHDPQGAERVDERLLDCAQVPVQVLLVVGQVEHRVAHQLAGAVEGHIAAALDLEDLDAARPER